LFLILSSNNNYNFLYCINRLLLFYIWALYYKIGYYINLVNECTSPCSKLLLHSQPQLETISSITDRTHYSSEPCLKKFQYLQRIWLLSLTYIMLVTSWLFLVKSCRMLYLNASAVLEQLDIFSMQFEFILFWILMLFACVAGRPINYEFG